MVERFDTLKRHPLFWTLLISALFHLVFLWFFAPRRQAWLFSAGPQVAVPESRERRVAFEIVETPKDTPEQEPDDPETRLRSDRSNRTANPNAPLDLPTGNTPYSVGNTRFNAVGSQGSGQITQPQMAPNPTQPSDEVPRSTESATSGKRAPARSTSNFNRDFLVQASSGMEGARLNQRESRAQDTGGLTLNTYAWEYAPYLLELKRRIQKNIYPPPVFTRLGQGGQNVMRFRIYPDGRLEGPLLIETRGEKALEETSRKAITLSAPFPALPKDFPEPFLEVTARFDYSI